MQSLDALEAPATLFTEEQLAAIDLQKSPQHVAIIMDGNRRWAKQRGLPLIMGHWEGAKALTDIVRAAAELNIKTLTVYAFSTENWRRSKPEVDALMHIFEVYLQRERAQMVRDGVRLQSIGDLSPFSSSVRDILHHTKEATEHCDRINLVLALNYGGRDELRRVICKILQEKNLQPHEITEEYISQFLDTQPWGDPDLLIRTGGELRLSNFLLWQVSYSEIYIADAFWPDMSPQQILTAVSVYQKRKRRFGV